MIFLGNNNIRTYISFKNKHINSIFKLNETIINLKDQFKDIQIESYTFKNEKSFFILKGYSNISIFESYLQELGPLEEFKKTDLNDSSLFFDIKILQKKDLELLNDIFNCILANLENWINLVIKNKLFQFKFLDFLSNYIYLHNSHCIRLYFKDMIDFEYASLEFANYIRDGGKDFAYPSIFKEIKESNQGIKLVKKDEIINDKKSEWDTWMEEIEKDEIIKDNKKEIN